MSTSKNVRPPKIRRVFFFLSGKRALPYSAGLLISVTLVCAALYTILTPLGHGVKIGDDVPENFGFFSGLYFSIVTISSLGYGDVRPVGFSRVLATAEVILGLSSIGIMIAALSSRQLSHLVSRLFASDARKRLSELSASFDQLDVRFGAMLRNISLVYTPTPKGLHRDEDVDTRSVSVEFRGPVNTLLDLSESTYEYFRDESAEGNFFDIVPQPALAKLLRSSHQALFTLSQCLISLPFRSEYQIFSEVLRRSDRNNIMDSIEALKKTCAIGLSQSHNQEVRESFQRLDDICERVSNVFFQVPQEELPDQILDTTQMPQTPTAD